MVFDLSYIRCHPMTLCQVDVMSHTIPYPIKTIHIGAQVGDKMTIHFNMKISLCATNSYFCAIRFNTNSN